MEDSVIVTFPRIDGSKIAPLVLVGIESSMDGETYIEPVNEYLSTVFSSDIEITLLSPQEDDLNWAKFSLKEKDYFLPVDQEVLLNWQDSQFIILSIDKDCSYDKEE